ncbi:mannose-1-phosphate guanylyltransferase [Limisphaera sp. 4302-co]|uniref:mannose-1-phosphate guanylyltransferase n=1 Tax=Limisphaera sp. 4302-co TaxID=3400417 RepID=UPI003C14DEEC
MTQGTAASQSDRFYVVLMAGGRGERFWPLSRGDTPKHLLPLWNGRSLLQLAVERVAPVVPRERILVITTVGQAPKVRRQLGDLPAGNVIVEPVGRDTCAAVTLGAALVGARCPDAVMAMLPADHIIHDVQAFGTVLRDALLLAAREPVIVTLGVPPTEPATGYGYIRLGETRTTGPADLPGGTRFYNAEAFVEKPSLERAREYLQSGRYRWNAGMFIWSYATLLEGLREHQPRMHETALRWVETARTRPSRLREVLVREYPELPRISIDYALMEKARNVVVADATFDWDDVGSWTALARHLPAGENGNVFEAEAVAVDSSGNLVYDARSRGTRTPVALVGVQETVVVLTRDAVLLVHKSQAQKVRELVRKLEEDPRYRKLL